MCQYDFSGALRVYLNQSRGSALSDERRDRPARSYRPPADSAPHENRRPRQKHSNHRDKILTRPPGAAPALSAVGPSTKARWDGCWHPAQLFNGRRQRGWFVARED